MRAELSTGRLAWRYRMSAMRCAGAALGLLVAFGAVVAVTAARAEEETRPAAAPQLPGGSRVPEVRRLPSGEIVPAPAPVAGTSTGPAAPPPAPAAARPAPRTVAPAAQPATPAVSRPPAQAVSSPSRGRFSCPASAITCVQITESRSAGERRPVTFGQPFKRGDAPSPGSLVAVDEKGRDVPLQLDQVATHPDGSVRFAVVSLELPKMAAGQTHVVALQRGQAQPAATERVAAEPAKLDLGIELTLYSRQISFAKFGNRAGTTPGIPFQVGEVVGLKLVSRSATERYSVTISQKMSGGNLDPYLNIAQAFLPVINGASKHFRAFWSGANDAYERTWITTVDNSEPFEIVPEYGGKARIAVETYLPVEPPEKWVARLPASGRTWLQGQVATETELIAPLISERSGQTHPHLSARVHMRRYHGSGAVRADVVVENAWAYKPGARNFTYDVEIKQTGKTVFRSAFVPHYHHARWHKVFWSEGYGEAEVVHHAPYLLESGSVPHYDPHLAIPDAVLQRDFDALTKSNTDLMGTAQVVTYMPTTGGRADIAPLPRWAVIYLLSMDRRARAILFANADAGAGIPVHYRDQETDLPVSIDHLRPFPAVTIGQTPWTPQIAHHPSLFYLPYLLTGDLFYLEEVAFWADWVLLSVNDPYRQGAKGLIYANEIRGVAWSLRTLGEAAAVLPDRHPLKEYFKNKVRNNIEYFLSRWVHNADPMQSPAIGIVPKPDEPGMMSPWQQDFLFIAVAQLAEQGTPGAEELLRWLGRFSVGRWTSDAQGFCHRMAPAYYIKIRNDDQRYIGTLKELFHKNWPDVATCPAAYSFGEPGSSGGYIANSYAMLGLAVDFGFAGAREALDRLRAEVPGMLTSFATDPSFAIVPRK